MQNKKCSRCHKIKPLSDYNKQSSNKDGLRKKCRDCRNLEMRNYRETGRTTVNEFEAKELVSLDAVFENLKEAYKVKGISLYKIKNKLYQ